jgi:SAM-dependent methyltransferase
MGRTGRLSLRGSRRMMGVDALAGTRAARVEIADAVGAPSPHHGVCRSCSAPLADTFADLGMSPPSNAYRRRDELGETERFHPLHALVCARCFLVQLGEFESPERIFGDYAYFSSYSDSWLRHAREYVDAAVERLQLGPGSMVVEVASNDGYLLRNFVARGIPCLGIDPAANVAAVAQREGVPTRVAFFGTHVARELVADGIRADLLVANNVLAHVPALNDFVGGVKILLAPDGTATFEFPHLLRLIEGNQFDTIYHEHFSYFSLGSVSPVFERHGLRVSHVEELATHGGSLRLHVVHAEAEVSTTPAVAELLKREADAGLRALSTYAAFDARVRFAKRRLLEFLITTRDRGQSVVGYGAAAKGNTLLNFCGIRGDFVDYVADRSPHKQGLFLPGTHIPVVAPEEIDRTRPDYVLILPWNLRAEVVASLGHIRGWGGKFVVPIPCVEVIE